MGGSATTTTNQKGGSTSSVAPWEPAQPLLQTLLSGLGQYGSSGLALTPGQKKAQKALMAGAQAIPQLGPEGLGAVRNAFGMDTGSQADLLRSAYGSLSTTLSPYMKASYLNPYSTPGLGDALSTMKEDITNSINGHFAGAGRAMSADNSKALSRGLSQGLGGLLANQFNQNVAAQQAAAGQQFGAGSTTAGGLTQQQLAQIQGQMAGLQGAGALAGLYTAPGSAQLGAANAVSQLPLSNISALESLGIPIAGLGNQSQGTYWGTSQTTQPQNTFGNILGGITSGLGLLGSFSDVRMKEGISIVGRLFNGLTVYRFRYRGDPIVRIGLMAHEVETIRPEAVSTHPSGFKMVDYLAATQ